jgi:hypothetical protein
LLGTINIFHLAIPADEGNRMNWDVAFLIFTPSSSALIVEDGGIDQFKRQSKFY